MEEIKIGDAIQGLGGLTHPNTDNLHFTEEDKVTVDELVEDFKEVDMTPDLEPQLTEEDLKQTTFEEHAHIDPAK